MSEHVGAEYRIVGACAARIEIDDKLVLIRSKKDHERRGLVNYSSVGGGYRIYEDEHRERLCQDLNCYFEEPEKKDLKLRTKDLETLAKFQDWFDKRIERELTVGRELKEELVEEEREEQVILANLDLEHYTSTLLGSWHRPGVSDRFPEMMNHTFFEVFEVKLRTSLATKILEVSEADQTRIILASPDQIQEGRGPNGELISDFAKCLIRYQQ